MIARRERSTGNRFTIMDIITNEASDIIIKALESFLVSVTAKGSKDYNWKILYDVMTRQSPRIYVMN